MNGFLTEITNKHLANNNSMVPGVGVPTEIKVMMIKSSQIKFDIIEIRFVLMTSQFERVGHQLPFSVLL